MYRNYDLIGIFQTPIIKIKFKDHYKYNFPEVEKRDIITDSWHCSVNTSFPFEKTKLKSVTSLLVTMM